MNKKCSKVLQNKNKSFKIISTLLTCSDFYEKDIFSNKKEN